MAPFLPGSLCASPAVKIGGDVQVTIYAPDGAVQQRLASTFVVWVDPDANKWRIKIVDGQSNTCITGCDGKDIYTVIQGSPDYAKEDHAFPALATGGTFPIDSTWQTSLPWLAFASGKYLDSLTEYAMPGVWGLDRHDAEAWALTNYIKRFPSPPGLPESIEYVVDKARQAGAMTNSHLLSYFKPQELRASVYQYRPNFTNAIFRILSRTNVQGVEFPVTFSLNRFYPKFNMKAEFLGPALIVAFAGTATEFSREEVAAFSPEIEKPVSVTDFRFEKKDIGVDYINYNITNRQWLAREDPFLQPIFARKIKMARENVNEFLRRKSDTVLGPMTNRVVAIVVVLVALGPLLFHALRPSKKSGAGNERTP